MMSAQSLFCTKFLLASTLLFAFFGCHGRGQTGSIHFMKTNSVNPNQWQTTRPVTTVYSNPYTTNYKRAASAEHGGSGGGGGGGGGETSGGGWGQPEGHTQVEPWTFNYQVIPEKQKHHHHHQPEHHHHHHGWGWKKPKKGKGEFDGVELLEVIKGIGLLKIGSLIVIIKLFILIFLLASVSKLGLILSPVAFPMLAFPIAVVAKFLFLTLLFLSMIFIGLLFSGEGKGGEEGHEGWGWSGGERRRRKRYRRQIPGVSLNPVIRNQIMSIMQRFPSLDFHFLPPQLLNRLVRREKIKISTNKR